MKKKMGFIDGNIGRELNKLELGAKIKERRKERKITQRKLADMAGVSGQFISLVETGRAAPSLATFHKIVIALAIDINELINNTHNTIEYSSIEEVTKEDWSSLEVKELREKLDEYSLEKQRLKMLLWERDLEIREEKSLTLRIVANMQKICGTAEKLDVWMDRVV